MRKPFTVLKHAYNWGYKIYWRGHRGFIDPNRVMMFERRELMSCKDFIDRIKLFKTKDAGYKVYTLREFLDKCSYDGDCVSINDKYGWNLDLIRFGLKLVKNAEICYPEKEFPLIIRNDFYNFYIAPKLYEVD